jgi:2-keto-3-deoxy-L-rhamnonate aldolase RhmA
MSSTESDVERIVDDESPDIIYIDSQHGPHTEWDVVRISKAAEAREIPVMLRIKHTRHNYLIGNHLDLGPMSIKVPQVETVEDVQTAVDNFYFPPFGKRSWGGRVGFGIDAFDGDRVTYAEWWNRTGVLCMKIESINAVLNVRSLAIPGVDFLDYGGEDLSFDLETQKHPHFKTIEDCKAHVRQELEGNPVRIIG